MQPSNFSSESASQESLRLQSLEDRFALQDLLTTYCGLVDGLANLDGLVGLFTSDAKLDVSAIGLPCVCGQREIRSFFGSVFQRVSHCAHYWSNFTVVRRGTGDASIGAYAIGLAQTIAGEREMVYVQYVIECVRVLDGWRIRQFEIKPRMPIAS
jgi:SnoaL-like domain